MYKRNPVFKVTTLSASNKAVAVNSLKKNKFAVSVLANLDAQIDVLLSDESTVEQKYEAVSILTSENTVLYTQISREACKALCKKINSLNFVDFLNPPYFKKGIDGTLNFIFLNQKKVEGNEILFRLAVPVTTYTIKNGTSVEFHIQWTYVIPPKYEESEELPPEPVPPTPVTHNVVVTNNASAIVTAVEPSSAEVEDGQSFTATLTFAEGKSADDITVTGATVSGNTITVANVSDDVEISISVKE